MLAMVQSAMLAMNRYIDSDAVCCVGSDAVCYVGYDAVCYVGYDADC